MALPASWFEPPHGFMAIVKCYGAISVVNGIVLPKDWEYHNMILVHADWLPKGILYVNRKVWPMIEAAFLACLALNDGYVIKTLGCFNPRVKRVNGDLSLHSFGIAIDLNSNTNPLSLDGVLRSDIPSTWVDIFESYGWTWGGRFSKPDAMHFQYASGY